METTRNVRLSCVIIMKYSWLANNYFIIPTSYISVLPSPHGCPNIRTVYTWNVFDGLQIHTTARLQASSCRFVSSHHHEKIWHMGMINLNNISYSMPFRRLISAWLYLKFCLLYFFSLATEWSTSILHWLQVRRADSFSITAQCHHRRRRQQKLDHHTIKILTQVRTYLDF